MRYQLVVVVCLFCLTAVAQTRPSPVVTAYLEKVLECESNPQPAKVIRVLRTSGDIEMNSHMNYDSYNFFSAKKPIVVWGFKVESVFGFDQDRLFERGPGTAPPITFGVVIAESPATIKQRLAKLKLKGITVEVPDLNDVGDPRSNYIPPNRAWISCSNQ